MTSKHAVPNPYPSFADARRVFTGERGGEGNLAATSPGGAAARNVPRSDLSSSWIRPQSISQLKQRKIANTHEEEAFIHSLLSDADWSHRLGTHRFARCLKEVLGRRDINGIPIENVPTEPLLGEVIATMADQEAKNASNDPSDRAPTSPADGDDEPIMIRIDVPRSLATDTPMPPTGTGGGSVSGGEGNLAAADTRPPLPRSRSRPRKERDILRALREQYDDAEFTTNLITDEVSVDLHPDAIREIASSMIEKLHTVTFPGNPANHCDDGPHNQLVSTILHFSPGNHRKSIAYLNKDQSDWMAHYTTLYSLMPMLWLIEEYSPSDAAYAYKGYDATRCMLSKRCIPLIKVFLKSLRYSMSRSSGIAYENFNSPMHYVPWITAE